MFNNLLNNFDYPVSINLNDWEAYYLNLIEAQEELPFSILTFDDNHIPQRKYLKKNCYNPFFIALRAILHLQLYLKHNDLEAKAVFLSHLYWIKNNYVEKEDTILWEYDFYYYEGNILMPPWISSISQGVCISVLCRAHKLFNDTEALLIANKAANSFKKPLSKGGLQVTINKSDIIYEEYPVFPPPMIFDGFAFSLLGLHDLYTITQDKELKSLFDIGIKTIENNISIWNYKNFWSWYGNYTLLSTPQYNKWNSCLIIILGNLSNSKLLIKTGEKWDPKNLNLFQKIDYRINYKRYYLRRKILLKLKNLFLYNLFRNNIQYDG
jgi:hypothetical protein